MMYPLIDGQKNKIWVEKICVKTYFTQILFFWP